MDINKHGLSRYIPPPIKFRIRKNCGFGCVICGTGVIQYDHVEPEFNDAKQHDPDRMTLLCGTCHDRKTRKFLSVATIKRAMQNPKAKQKGFSIDSLDIGIVAPKIKMGGSVIENCPIPIAMQNVPIFTIKPPEEAGAPYRFSAFIFDIKGNLSLRIEDNEIKAFTTNWDVEFLGGKLIIRDDKKVPLISLRTIEPDTVVLEFIRIFYKGSFVIGDEKSLFVGRVGGPSALYKECLFSNNVIGINL